MCVCVCVCVYVCVTERERRNCLICLVEKTVVADSLWEASDVNNEFESPSFLSAIPSCWFEISEELQIPKISKKGKKY